MADTLETAPEKTSLLKSRIRLRLRHLQSIIRNIHASFGLFPRECPVCSYSGKFLGMGLPYAIDAACPQCTAGHRQRFAILTMARLNFAKNSRILHIAPERLLADWMKQNGAAYYLSGDLYNEADITLNIEHMDLEDAAFDVIICMHVLEHVNDQKALSEMRRVLRPGGTAFLMMPVVEGWDQTYENPSIQTDSGRLLHFGQEDHVRYYGRDIRDRLTNFFEVEEITAVEPDVSRYALLRGEKIFLCRRRLVD